MQKPIIVVVGTLILVALISMILPVMIKSTAQLPTGLPASVDPILYFSGLADQRWWDAFSSIVRVLSNICILLGIACPLLTARFSADSNETLKKWNPWFAFIGSLAVLVLTGLKLEERANGAEKAAAIASKSLLSYEISVRHGDAKLFGDKAQKCADDLARAREIFESVDLTLSNLKLPEQSTSDKPAAGALPVGTVEPEEAGLKKSKGEQVPNKP